MIRAIIALVIAMLFTTSCDQIHNHSHQGDGTTKNIDHIDQESRTLFSEKLELFVEFDPVVVGETSIFNVHLTNLNDYSPLADANISLSLEIDSEVTQNFESHSDFAGIYHFEVSPQFGGEGLITIKVETTYFKDQFELDHIHIFREAAHIHSHGQGAVTGQVSFTKEQAWSTDFRIDPVIKGDFSKVINASGEIMPMPGEKQNLIAKNNGIVLFSTRNLVQGSPVKKGSLLFTISGKGFTDDNISVKYHEARLQFEKSRNQYLRHKNLVEEKIVSERQFEESTNRYLADSVAYFNLEQTVSDGGLKVFAPLTGYIHDLNFSEGQYASTGSVLATISSNKVMLLRADVPQQYFKVMGQINDATFRPAYSEKVYTIEELNGKLLAKASSVAENNHYMPVYFEVINDGTLLEGAFAEFHLKTESQTGKLIIPVEAIIEEQNIFYVYVQVSGESYLKKQVQIGGTDGLFAEIESGLEEGERVVTRGSILLKAATVSSAPVHSHSH